MKSLIVTALLVFATGFAILSHADTKPAANTPDGSAWVDPDGKDHAIVADNSPTAADNSCCRGGAAASVERQATHVAEVKKAANQQPGQTGTTDAH